MDKEKSKKLKNSKLTQFEKADNKGEEFAEEDYFGNQDQLDAIMQRIDKFWYDDKEK